MGRKFIFKQTNLPSTSFLTGLVAYYSFDASNATDIHTGTHNGTVFGSPTFPSGKNSNCIDFANNTSLNYFTIADSNDFSFTNGTTDVPFSMSMWVNFSAFSATGNWFLNKRSATTGGDEWQLMYLSGAIYFSKLQYNNNAISQNIITNTGLFSTGTWYHVVYTDDGSGSVGSGKIYIDGALNVASNSNSGGTYTRMNNGNFSVFAGINGWSPSDSLKHKGKIDEIAIWKNKELTSIEVTQLYNAGAGKFYNTF